MIAKLDATVTDFNGLNRKIFAGQPVPTELTSMYTDLYNDTQKEFEKAQQEADKNKAQLEADKNKAQLAPDENKAEVELQIEMKPAKTVKPKTGRPRKRTPKE